MLCGLELHTGWLARAESPGPLLPPLSHRFAGPVGLLHCTAHARSMPPCFHAIRPCTVVPVLVPTQVHIQPRDEAAAKHGIHRLESDVVGIRAWRRNLHTEHE